MIGYLRNLIHWFFHGNEPLVQESEPAQTEVEEKTSDNRLPSEKVFSDIFEAVRGHDILDEMKKLETATHRFEKAREDLVKEIRNINPRRIN